MFKDTFDGATSFCEACEREARALTPLGNHTCGKGEFKASDFEKGLEKTFEEACSEETFEVPSWEIAFEKTYGELAPEIAFKSWELLDAVRGFIIRTIKSERLDAYKIGKAYGFKIGGKKAVKEAGKRII